EGRMVPGGGLRPVDVESAPRAARGLRRAQVQAVAVCLLHSYADPGHELETARILRRQLPGVFVVASCEIAGEYREFERASTTSIDAYLGPVVRGYLRSLRTAARRRGLPEPALMQSSGGLAAVAEVAAHPARLLLSGPAGGVAAVAGMGGSDAIA